jgi:hypothetical protein
LLRVPCEPPLSQAELPPELPENNAPHLKSDIIG